MSYIIHTKEAAAKVSSYCERVHPACPSSWTASPYSWAEFRRDGFFSALNADGLKRTFEEYTEVIGDAALKELSTFHPIPYISAHHDWTLPIVALCLYFLVIIFLQKFMKNRDPISRSLINPILCIWNISLSLYSFAGIYLLAPHLFGALMRDGLRSTVCRGAFWYGFGKHGLFVALFIYSKFFELFDTIFLILKKRPVIFLHWYHHCTVLLYCWHSYGYYKNFEIFFIIHVSHGIWFATMNYFVHSLMYMYFALTVYPSTRRFVKPFSMFLTTLQLSQMVVGIFITVMSGIYADDDSGLDCHVNRTNSLLGLCMYFSYFLLFGVFFMKSYCTKKKGVHGQKYLKKSLKEPFQKVTKTKKRRSKID